jgi:hypothetical protein
MEVEAVIKSVAGLRRQSHSSTTGWGAGETGSGARNGRSRLLKCNGCIRETRVSQPRWSVTHTSRNNCIYTNESGSDIAIRRACCLTFSFSFQRRASGRSCIQGVKDRRRFRNTARWLTRTACTFSEASWASPPERKRRSGFTTSR